MNESNEEVIQETVTEEVQGAVEKTPEEVTADTIAASTDNNAPVTQPVVCGISGIEIKEGDQVVTQVIMATEESEGYSRLVLVSSLTEDEKAALPEGFIKTYSVAA